MGNGWEEEKQGIGHREARGEELEVEGDIVGRATGFSWASCLGLRLWHQAHLGLSPGSALTCCVALEVACPL